VPHGEEIAVADVDGRPIGWGLGSAHSQIAIRLFDREPATAADADLIGRRLRQAVAWRDRIWPRPCRRLVSSEADLLPGLIVDQYHDRLVVQCTTVGMDRRLALCSALLRDLLAPAQIVERNDLAVRTHDRLPSRTGVLHGPPETRMTATLGGIAADIDLLDPHKTGAYLDQQASHLALAAWLPAGAPRVLDVCCHLGGFALHALAAGAREAVAVDTSAPALALATAAAARAGDGERFVPVAADAFAWLRAASDRGEVFDAIILDPPSFAKNRDSIAGALRGYRELHVRALHMLRPGGMLAAFSCSHHIGPEACTEVAVAAAADTGRTLRILATPGAAPDHPVLPAVPETRYLSGLVCAVVA
jgi:23S rRNA (cytosine1962-C5)-methyltransferase